ncbi:MAG TPA: site-specific integrase [Acidimicrobiales bacterium]|nr:site-specific integrase [Acidimicrobiales bacterium]
MLGQLQGGAYVKPRTLTLGAYLTEQWLPAIRTSVRRGTFRSYSEHVSAYITPRLGSLGLQQVSPTALNAFYADLLTNGRRRDGSGLHPSTVRRVHATLHRALRDAVKWRLLAINPADHSDPPKQRQAGSTELRTWLATEVDAFLAHVTGDRLEAAWILTATTGMRRGEVLGLRWEDVDLVARRAAVRQTLTAAGHKLALSTPKTSRGRRSVPLPATTVEALRTHRCRQLEERLAWGPAYRDGDLVFTREDGSPVHPDAFSDAFNRHAREADLPRIRLHDLRHTFATLALVSGVPVKVVSEILGHSTHSFTADVYQHLVPALQEDAAERVADLIFGSRVDKRLTGGA